MKHLKSAIKNPKWLAVVAAVVTFAACEALSEAQQPKKIRRIGILLSGSRNPIWGEAFRQALREVVYIDGQNVAFEYRNAEGKSERQAILARELVATSVDVLVAAGGNDVTGSLMRATKTIPIIMTAGSNPVARGLIASLARPGGNVTGITAGWDDLSGKRLELLKETIPKLLRVAVLWNSTYGHNTQWRASQVAAKSLKLELYSMQIQSTDDFKSAFNGTVKARSEALAVTQSSEIGTGIGQVIQLAIKHRLPAIYAIPEYSESGGLMAYGGSRSDLARHTAVYIDKILRGAKAAELPVEQPAKFEFVINLKTAKEIGFTVPPNVLARADKVIK